MHLLLSLPPLKLEEKQGENGGKKFYSLKLSQRTFQNHGIILSLAGLYHCAPPTSMQLGSFIPV